MKRCSELLEDHPYRSGKGPDSYSCPPRFNVSSLSLSPLAREIADNTAPVSIALTRQMLWRMAGQDHPMKAHRVDSRAIQSRGQSADAREGVSAFLEKRPAVYADKVSTDMPDFFPWWDEPDFE